MSVVGFNIQFGFKQEVGAAQRAQKKKPFGNNKQNGR
jgi:hypothetical protein